MFLCDDCHLDLAGEEWPHPRSFGRCEGCGKTVSCLDCHCSRKQSPTVDDRRTERIVDDLKALREELS